MPALFSLIGMEASFNLLLLDLQLLGVADVVNKLRSAVAKLT